MKTAGKSEKLAKITKFFEPTPPKKVIFDGKNDQNPPRNTVSSSQTRGQNNGKVRDHYKNLDEVLPEIVSISKKVDHLKNVDHIKTSNLTIGPPDSSNSDHYGTSKSAIVPPDLDNNISSKNTPRRRV